MGRGAMSLDGRCGGTGGGGPGKRKMAAELVEES